MKSPSDHSHFDAEDQQVAAALNEAPVPVGAKLRASQRLAMFAMDDADEGALENESSASSAGPKTGRHLSADFAPQPDAVSQTMPTVQRSESGGWMQRHRVRIVAFCVAASLFLAAGAYFISRPVDQELLLAVCTQNLDAQLQDRPNWQTAEPDDLSGLLTSINLTQVPTSINQVQLNKPPFGKTGQLWMLTFENREALYVFEFQAAAAVKGVGQAVRILPSSSNSWTLAASQDAQQLLVVVTKGNLNQYLKLVSLA